MGLIKNQLDYSKIYLLNKLKKRLILRAAFKKFKN